MKLITSTIIAAALFAANATAQESAYKYELNKPYTYMMESKGTTKQDVMGQSVTVTDETNAAFSLTVTERMPDGSMNAKIDVSSAVIFQDGPEGMKTYGDDLAGKSFTFSMEATSDVTDLDSAAGTLNPFSQRSLQQMIRFLPYLPADKAKDGESWTRDRLDTSGTEQQPIYVETTVEYEVDGTEDVNGIESLVIKAKGEQSARGEISRGDQDYTLMEESEPQLTYYYAEETGIITRVNQINKSDRVITMPSNPSFQVNITISGTVKIEYVAE